MTQTPIGLISSAGSETLLRDRRAESVPTPWGAAEVLTGMIGGVPAAVVLRYGPGLTVPSHAINYRANIWALRELGVREIVSQNAIGSVNTAIRPGDIVVSDDFLDRTKARPLSLFDGTECWVRVDFTEPFCPRVRRALIKAARRHSDRVIERGVFVCTEGRRFETPAEICAYRQEGGDIVGTPLVTRGGLRPRGRTLLRLDRAGDQFRRRHGPGRRAFRRGQHEPALLRGRPARSRRARPHRRLRDSGRPAGRPVAAAGPWRAAFTGNRRRG